MPFDIKSMSEVFQKKNEEEFAGILGVCIVADDNIIAAKYNQEHNHILTKILQIAMDCNIVFNVHKLRTTTKVK